MKLRIYAIAVTLILVAVLTNPPAEAHYVKLAQLYPWVIEFLLQDAKFRTWRLSPPADREAQPPYGSYDSANARSILTYQNYGVVSFVYQNRLHLGGVCGTGYGPPPISIGFLGHVFAKRPASGPQESESAAKQSQVELYVLSFYGQPLLDLKPAEAPTNSFGIKGPTMIDMPPRPKDALYKLGPLE